MRFFLKMLLVLIGAMTCPLFSQKPALPPTGLLCDLLREPARVVITDANPEFSWIVNDSSRGAVQAAYQIRVASSQDKLADDQADFWDSGMVRSDQSVAVTYQGKALKSFTRYWWQVRTWSGANQVSSYSDPQEFRTGNLEAEPRAWPTESKWVQWPDEGQWLLENRQRSDYHQIAPVRMVRHNDQHFFFDFGKAAFATLKLTLPSAPTADSVTVFLGERCTADHLVHKNPGVSNIGFKRITIPLQTDCREYTLILPRHISHYPNSQVLAEHMLEVAPFRYVEIIDSPCELSLQDVRQVALFYYFDDQASGFRCSDDRLNQVWDLCKYTLKATPFLALYADGNRERMPYEADAYIQQLGHYAVDREFSVARYTHQFLLFNASWPTEWQMHTLFIAWADYMQTGDRETLENYYPDLRAKTLLALAREDGLISTITGLATPEFGETIHYRGNALRDIVDWPAGTPPGKKQANNAGPIPEGDRDGYDFKPYNTVVNAFHYRSLVLMEQIAGALGKIEEAMFFAQRAELVRNRFQTAFFDKKRGIYRDGIDSDHASLHANMFPLAFGLVPAEQIPSVVRFVKSRGMACSVYGAQYLLDALYPVGEAQYALDLMTSDSQRSWLNMMRVGSTMTTEAWDEYYKPNLTWNHAWGSAPANIVARQLFGIQPLEPGFRTFKIQPQPANLQWAKIRVPTIRGTVVCDYRTDQDRRTLRVTIPANTIAQIHLDADPKRILEEGQPIARSKWVEMVSSEDGKTVLKVPAGTFMFSW